MKNLSQEDSVVQNEAATIKDEELQTSGFVFKNFFEKYSLSESKEILEKWLLSSFENDKEDAALYYSFKKEIEAVLETSVLNSGAANGMEKIEFQKQSAVVDEKDVMYLEDITLNFNNSFMDLKESPMEVLTRIFEFSLSDEVKFVLEEWKLFCLGHEQFIEFFENEDLININVFCKDFQKVIEALYVLCAANSCKLPYRELKLNQKYLFLTENEIKNPYLVLESFKQLINQEQAIQKLSILIINTCAFANNTLLNETYLIENIKFLLCMIRAPYLLLKKDLELLSRIEYLKIREEKHDWLTYLQVNA